MKSAAPMTRTAASPFQLRAEGCFSAAEFAAGFDLPVGFIHGPAGVRVKVALADITHDVEAARGSDCPFTASLGEIIAQLDASPVARALLQAAVADGVTVGLDRLMPASSGYYYPAQAHIDLGQQDAALQMTEKGLGQYMAAFITALRHHWQDSHGHAPVAMLRPADYADHHRLVVADGEAVLQLTAWELRGQGHTYLWRALLAGDAGDITTAFEQSVTAEPQSQFDGRALKCAFNQWFACRGRIARADLHALELLDAALVRTQGTPARKSFASKALERDTLERLGGMPDGSAYLKDCIFTCAWYAGFDDEDAQKRLRHIEQEISQFAVFS